MLDQLYTRYIGASVASLGVDFAIFMAALSLGVPPALAAATGYIAGIVCHWLISSRFVFTAQLAADGSGSPEPAGPVRAVGARRARHHDGDRRTWEPFRPRSPRSPRASRSSSASRRPICFARRSCSHDRRGRAATQLQAPAMAGVRDLDRRRRDDDPECRFRRITEWTFPDPDDADALDAGARLARAGRAGSTSLNTG